MAIPQTVVDQYMGQGLPGLLYDTDFRDTMSYTAEADVPFGVPVILGTNPERQVKAMGTGAGQAALVTGIAVWSASTEAAYPQNQSALPSYPATKTVPVLKRGRIWVNTAKAVTAGSAANVVLATGLFTDAVVATGIEALVQVKATFITGNTAAGLAVVEIK